MADDYYWNPATRQVEIVYLAHSVEGLTEVGRFCTKMEAYNWMEECLRNWNDVRGMVRDSDSRKED